MNDPHRDVIRIEATSYRDALRQIDLRFGKDVSIVSTRKIKRPGVMGALGANGVEVYVTHHDNHIEFIKHQAGSQKPAQKRGQKSAAKKPPGKNPPGKQPPPAKLAEKLNSMHPRLGPQRVPRKKAPAKPGREAQSSLPGVSAEQLSELMAGVKKQVEHLTQEGANTQGTTPPAVSPVLQHAEQMLEDGGFSRQVIADLVEKLAQRDLSIQGNCDEIPVLARARLDDLIRPKIPPCMPIQPRRAGAGPTVVALVGPTGVGKTTTIAKLASHFHLKEKKSVGLITMDTYRIGAVDQLRRFSDIMGLPLEVIEQGGRVQDALDTYRDRDVVFVDTAGRSQKDAVRLAHVRDMLNGIGSLEVHLCTALGCARETILEVANKFGIIPYNRLLITKQDEAARHGVLLDLFQMARIPVSYITYGQEVPDDIHPASEERLVNLLLGE